ncbi:acetate kinase [Pleurocapsales cyanobacterium LEGE 06147]|nr:acetate kinase [Pleurocapsales cyanobacterium LEGE 06147]
MQILAINCGSSTLKFQVIDIDNEGALPKPEQKLARGKVEGIGSWGGIKFAAKNDKKLQEDIQIADYQEAIKLVFDWLEDIGFLSADALQAVGHRVVHGGDRFREPTLIDREVIAALDDLTDLAPLHNAPSLNAIRATSEILGSSIPMVATFDTTFHCTLPEKASQYAIDQELATKYRIRRYGFHGLAHRYMLERYAAITNIPVEQTKIITLQLGSGCSATAIANGRSVDTSMGFTPLEGLMMGTRCGDIDPSLPGFLVQREGVDTETVEEWLNKRSGLLGVSGRSSDMRELIEAERQGDKCAALAIEMFCYRVRKCIGAYLAVLDDTDAVVFGGGIGENQPIVRDRICRGMDWCGLTIDAECNAKAKGTEEQISTEDARIPVYVIPVDEAAIIARDTVNCLHRNQ